MLGPGVTFTFHQVHPEKGAGFRVGLTTRTETQKSLPGIESWSFALWQDVTNINEGDGSGIVPCIREIT
jgi:hypothetical protein